MSYKVWERGLQASAILMNFMVAFCVETAIFAAFPTLATAMDEIALVQPGLFRQLCLILVPIVFWMIREYAKYFWLFVGAHGLVAVGAVWLLGETMMQRLVFGAFVAVYLVGSFRIRLTGHEMEDGHENLKGKGMEEKRMGVMISAVASGLTYLFCAYLGNEVGSRRIWNTALLFTFLYFIDVYLQNLNQFVQFNRSSNSHIPVKGMLVRGGSLTVGFGLMAVAVLMAGTDNSLMRGITDVLQQTALWLIRTAAKAIGWFLSLFESDGGEIVEESAAMEEAVQMGMAEAGESSLLMQILSKVIMIVLMIAVAAFICVVVYKLIAAAVRRFYQKRDKVLEEDGQMVEIRESLKKEKEKKKQEKALSFFARTPEERIRRSFVKTVRKTEKFRNPEGKTGGNKGRDIWRKDAQERLFKGLTARQISDVVGLTGQAEEAKTGWLGIELADGPTAAEREAAERLLSLYEKARYGRGSTAEDAKCAEQEAGKLG